MHHLNDSMRVVLWPLHALIWLSISCTAAAIDADELLDADVAFALSAEAISREQIKLSWDIAEGYYLYRHSLKFVSDEAGVILGSADIPSGKAYQDEFFGAVETYRHALTVNLPVKLPAGASELALQVSHQGCADLGVCYPPQRTMLSVQLPLPTMASQAGLAVPDADPLAKLLAGTGSSLPLLDAALPATEAFIYEVIATDATSLLVRMTPAPGYYLYRDKFKFSVPESGADVRAVKLPPGTPKYDEHFGDVQVYQQQVEIPVSLQRSDVEQRNIHLVADFQGCKDAGICYPPMRRQVQLELPPLSGLDQARPQQASAGASLSTGRRNEALQSMGSNDPGSDHTSELSEQDRLAATLAERPLFAMLLFFIAGLLLAFTPCVFPMVPILSGIIAGQGKDITTGRALLLSVVYVLAMAITYAVAGVIAGLSGENLQAAFQNPWIIGAFSGLFVLLALSMFGFYELQLPASLQSRLAGMSNRQHGGTLIGVAIMGLLSALIVGPCVAPALMAALIYIGQSGDAVLGGTALFAMALGMGVPLVIFGVSAGQMLPGAGAWMNGVKAFFGVGLLALAIWMLERVVPGGTVMLLWGLLLIGSAVYLGALDQVAHGWPRLWKALGIVLLLFGGMQLLGFAAGGDDWMRPLQSLRTSAGGAVAEARQLQFQRIKTVQDVQAKLALGGPVMLDFYADWCVECKRMEKTTFENAAVHQALAGVTLLQADVTANDAEDKALYQAYGLIGPPAILFFAADGTELRRRRVIGYLDSGDFLAHLQATFAAAQVQ